MITRQKLPKSHPAFHRLIRKIYYPDLTDVSPPGLYKPHLVPPAQSFADSPELPTPLLH